VPKLLLVDDDALSLQVLSDLVTAHGHAVVLAADARAALVALSTPGAKFDAVITDVRMPDIDGIDLVKRIRGKLPTLPLALMSAEPDFDIYEEAASRGVEVRVMLQKPFHVNALRRLLEQLVGVGRVEAPLLPAPAPDAAGRPVVPLGRDDALVWLAQGDVSIARLPPVRTWFVASRRSASGLLRLTLPTGDVVVPIRKGQLLRSPGQHRTPDGLASWLLALHDGCVRFDACSADLLPGTPIAGSGSVPDAVSSALARVPHATIQQAWRSVMSARAFARSPRDSLQGDWGLDALATLAHQAARGQRVDALTLELARRSPEFRTAGFRTLEMLLRLNLLTLLA